MARPVAITSDDRTDEVDAARAKVMARLVEGLLHDARNPLNALAIHAEVLAEKLRRANGGVIPPAQEKHLLSMKDQVRRIDEVLRRFGPFLGQEISQEERVDLSAVARAAAEIAGHAAKRGQVMLEVDEGAPLWTRLGGSEQTLLLVAAVVLWGVDSSGPKSEVRLSVERDGEVGRLRVRVPGMSAEASAKGLPEPLVRLAREVGGALALEGNAASMILPLE